MEMTQASSIASPSDIPLLVQMMTEFYAEANYSLDREWAANSFATIINRPDFGSVWLLRWSRDAAGYLVLTVRFSMEYGGLDAFIDDLFVRSQYRRCGVASEGLSLLLAECCRRQVRALHVEVAPNNVAANATYAKIGMALRPDRRQTLTVELKT
jgi:ribosomal protein S18 acetylase RimI-like enzyme